MAPARVGVERLIGQGSSPLVVLFLWGIEGWCSVLSTPFPLSFAGHPKDRRGGDTDIWYLTIVTDTLPKFEPLEAPTVPLGLPERLWISLVNEGWALHPNGPRVGVEIRLGQGWWSPSFGTSRNGAQYPLLPLPLSFAGNGTPRGHPKDPSKWRYRYLVPLQIHRYRYSGHQSTHSTPRHPRKALDISR